MVVAVGIPLTWMHSDLPATPTPSQVALTSQLITRRCAAFCQCSYPVPPWKTEADRKQVQA